MKLTLCLGAVALATTSAAIAGGEYRSTLADDNGVHYSQSSPDGRYRGNEFSMDFFGSAALGEHSLDNISVNRVRHDTRLGAGLGLNYFFCQYVGIGGEAYTENTSHNFIDNANASLIFRLPIGNTGLAPYAFGGAGYKFDPIDEKTAHLGGGLEYRFTRQFGIFADARFVWAERESDYGLARLGFRVAF